MSESNPLLHTIQHETIIPLDKVNSAYDEYYNILTSLQKDDIVVKNNCRFCLHPARAEAELVYEKTSVFKNVERFFEDYRKEHPESPEMPPFNIRNHIHNHYLHQQRKIWLREYSSKVTSVMNVRVSHEKRLELLLVKLELELDEIMSDPTLDRFKKVDAISKLSKVINEITRSLFEIQGDIKPIQIVMETFSQTWEKLIVSQSDPMIRNKLMNSLDDFKKAIEGGSPEIVQ